MQWLFTWWCGVEHSAALTVKHCSICTQDENIERNIGLGIQSCQRLRWLVVDDKILKPSITAVTSYVSVLSMVDPACGATMYRLRKSMSALEASAIIFCNWICRYSIPEKISSDNHGSFTAAVAKLICDILGVENRVFSAVYQSRSQAHVENRNRIISETLQAAEAKGDITCDLDLELYIAESEIKANQLVVTDGTTAFERCFGEPPRTVNASLSAPHMDSDDIEACVDSLNKIDGNMVRSIFDRCNSLMKFKAQQTDKRSRYNRAQLLNKESKRITSKFEYTVGSMVSYGGRKVTLDSLEPAGSSNPTTCWVTDRTGKSLHVRVDSLRPLSVDVDEKLMPKGEDWRREGAFIAFDSSEHGLSGGIITDLSSEDDHPSVDVHDWMPIKSKTGIVWGPVWMKDEKSQRSLSCPAGFEKRIITVLNGDVLCECTLQGRKFDVSTISRLENMGYDQFSP